MTKSELISEVAGKTWYNGIIGNPVVSEEWPTYNLKLYRVHLRVEREANVISTCHLYFYVFDEGEPGEIAYYKDKNPDDQIAIVTP